MEVLGIEMHWASESCKLWCSEDVKGCKSYFRVCHGRKMAHSQEQQYVIKFCFHLGKTAWERHALVKEAYKRDALSKAQIFWWFSKLKKLTEDRCGHGSNQDVLHGVVLDENVAKVNNFPDSQPSFECQINHRICQYVQNNGSQN